MSLAVLAASAPVTLRAVLKIAYALPNVLCPNLVGPMFMTAIASKATEVAINMTCRVVATFQQQELGVVKRGGLPTKLRTALRTIIADVTMNRRFRRLVAARALRPHPRLQEIMRKRLLMAECQNRTLMARVAAHAILRRQLLVECDLRRPSIERCAGRRT